MKSAKPIFLSYMFLMLSGAGIAQKETFDIVSYIAPAGWNKDAKDDYVSFSRIDGASWSQIAVYKSRQSSGNIEEDAQKDWQDIVLVGHTIEQESKTPPKSADGWQIMSRSGVWQYNGANVATVLTTYSNETICISVLWNGTAQPYMKNLKDFITSIALDANKVSTAQSNPANNEQQSGQKTGENKNTTSSAANTSIVGLWVTNQAEDNGFMNGYRMYTGGYMRKEYQFNANGTYLFRIKQWLTKAPDIIFSYESGTYTVQGNQLILTPKSGKAGFWGKKSSTKEWGPLKKSSTPKLEKTTYTVETISDPTYGNSIVLYTDKPTERDGGQFNQPPYRFAYAQRKESLIDNPPGFEKHAGTASGQTSN